MTSIFVSSGTDWITSPFEFAVCLKSALSLITIADLLFLGFSVFVELDDLTKFLIGKESSDEFAIGELLTYELAGLATSVLLLLTKPKSPHKPQTATTTTITITGVEIEFWRIG